MFNTTPPALRQCPHCGSPLRTTVRDRHFCELCGAQLSKKPSPSSPTPVNSSHILPPAFAELKYQGAGRTISDISDLPSFVMPPDFDIDPYMIAFRYQQTNKEGQSGHYLLMSINQTQLSFQGGFAYRDFINEFTILNPEFFNYACVKRDLEKEPGIVNETNVIHEIMRRRRAMIDVFLYWVRFQKFPKTTLECTEALAHEPLLVRLFPAIITLFLTGVFLYIFIQIV